jgi:HSP20 family protein
MAQQWTWLNIPTRPTLPPPPASADVYEPAGGEAYVIEMHVPGVKPEEIAVEVTPNSPRVSTDPGQPQDSGRREQEIRPWSRFFEFPMEINTDKVRVTMENGILKIYAPKASAGRPKVIRIGEPGEAGKAAVTFTRAIGTEDSADNVI